jgi:hypothetical protein
MDKQRPVNKVAHNDAYSSTLMEMYTRWMGGDCFQGSNISEAFDGMEPQSHGAEIEDTTKKKKTVKKEKSVAEGIRCTKCGGNHATEDCPGYKQGDILESHEIEIDGEKIIIEKVKGLDGKACWKGYKYAGTKMKGGKKVDDCVKAGFEPEGEEITEKKLDPVGKEDKDVDNDGDHDKSDKYLLARRKKVSKIIGMSKKK